MDTLAVIGVPHGRGTMLKTISKSREKFVNEWQSGVKAMPAKVKFAIKEERMVDVPQRVVRAGPNAIEEWLKTNNVRYERVVTKRKKVRKEVAD
ncbi:MAG TPA: hypothetical protein VNI77_10335 [Nitrososphaera sp.]|nr:hypothetical protein [Nitrososphaera sp.]